MGSLEAEEGEEENTEPVHRFVEAAAWKSLKDAVAEQGRDRMLCHCPDVLVQRWVVQHALGAEEEMDRTAVMFRVGWRNIPRRGILSQSLDPSEDRVVEQGIPGLLIEEEAGFGQSERVIVIRPLFVVPGVRMKAGPVTGRFRADGIAGVDCELTVKAFGYRVPAVREESAHGMFGHLLQFGFAEKFGSTEQRTGPETDFGCTDAGIPAAAVGVVWDEAGFGVAVLEVVAGDAKGEVAPFGFAGFGMKPNEGFAENAAGFEESVPLFAIVVTVEGTLVGIIKMAARGGAEIGKSGGGIEVPEEIPQGGDGAEFVGAAGERNGRMFGQAVVPVIPPEETAIGADASVQESADILFRGLSVMVYSGCLGEGVSGGNERLIPVEGAAAGRADEAIDAAGNVVGGCRASGLGIEGAGPESVGVGGGGFDQTIEMVHESEGKAGW